MVEDQHSDQSGKTQEEVFRQELHSRSFDTPEQREAYRTTKVLFAGCGSVGSPAAKSWLDTGGESIVVADPDRVEVSNLPRQNFRFDQEGKNKAQMTALNLRLSNPHASKSIRSVKEGITMDNVHALVKESSIIVDAIDIGALDVIYELHKEAAEQRKPVIVGYDLAGTAMAVIYRYDEKEMLPLNGELTEEGVQRFVAMKGAYRAGEISKSQFLDYVYDTFTGPVPPIAVPVEQLQEIINRSADETTTFQQANTSKALGALISETIKSIVNGTETKSVVYVDLPSEVRRHNPNIFVKAGLLIRTLKKLNERKERVADTLSGINI